VTRIPTGRTRDDPHRQPEAGRPHRPRRDLDNGLTPEKLIEAIIHLTFHAGRPTGMTATEVLASVDDAN